MENVALKSYLTVTSIFFKYQIVTINGKEVMLIEIPIKFLSIDSIDSSRYLFILLKSFSFGVHQST